jgi:hypothetical protein
MAVSAELRVQVLPGQRWVQAAIAASLILLAVIAVVVSYDHMHALALRGCAGAGHHLAGVARLRVRGAPGTGVLARWSCSRAWRNW